MDLCVWCVSAVLTALAVTAALRYLRYAIFAFRMMRLVKQSNELTEYMRSVLEAERGSLLPPDEVEELRKSAVSVVAQVRRSGRKLELGNVRMVVASTEDEARRKLQELCEKEKQDGR